MGYAIANAAQQAGWVVSLVSGPVYLEPPSGVDVCRVESAEDMLAACLARFPGADILIKCAAVCDMRPKHRSAQKVKKDELKLQVEFEPTPDILASLGAQRRENQLLVGFAAETENLADYARRKLVAKNLDYICANQVGGSASAFESERNQLTIFSKDGSSIALGPASKGEVADDLVKFLETIV